jgi:hypothetical protein
MPSHHERKHHVHEHPEPAKKGPGKGPKEKEIAATLTAATVALAGTGVTYASLEAAGDAVANLYERMFALVASRSPLDA